MPILALLILGGVVWAASRGWDAAWEGAAKARTAARDRAGQRGGHYNTDAVKRRAARQATIGWWVREARHKFPVTRQGLRQGWHDHVNVLAETEHEAARTAHERAKAGASREHERAGWRAEYADHRRRLEAAATKRQAAEKRQQQAAERRKQRTAPAKEDKHVAGDGAHYREVGGKTFGELDRMGKLDPDCPDCAKALAARDAGNGKAGAAAATPEANGKGPQMTAETNGAPAATDANYEAALEITEKVQAVADATDLSALDAIGPLVDGLGVVLNDDATTLGTGADLAQACNDAKASLARVKDLAAAMRDRVKTYEPQHEAVLAHDAGAPEASFHNS